MDQKTLQTLEYDKILDRLSGYCDFQVSVERARGLSPASHLEEANRRLAVTSEARQLLATHDNLTIGGARDVREPVRMARRAGLLTPQELLDVKSSLAAARNLARTIEKVAEEYPELNRIAERMPQPSGLIDAITRAISERGEILDSASEKLSNIRRDLRIVHDRLLSKLQKIANDPRNAQLLQESIITQRDGRYVLPLRAEFKGRLKSIVHDQSASGATLFVEPLSVVDSNNEYRELELAERDEERRILAELSHRVGEQSDDILEVLDIVAEIDVAFAMAKYAEDLGASRPRLRAFPERVNEEQPPRHPGSVIRLFQARHPLLDPRTVVPIDMELDPQTYAMIITGPNTGGKTVTLKTVGLLALMAQTGFHIPVQEGSEISLFMDVFADIGDEQSIEQSLSTFSSHITNIIRILVRAGRRSLVILDELGAGTDPQEGAALARALLTHLLERGITTLVTTHHPELKAYAHTTSGVVNASVEFNLETLQPTYHLTVGLPGRSNALAIAQRLGLPVTIVSSARSELNPEDLRAEDLLDEIHRQRDLARQARAEAEQASHEAQALRADLAERLEHIEDERREVLEKARQEAEVELQEMQDDLRKARRDLASARQPLEALKAVEEQVESLEEEVEKPVERRPSTVRPQGEQLLRRSVRLGDKVRLRKLNTKGVVTSLGEEEAEVQVGNLRVRAALGDLVPVGGGVEGAPSGETESRPRRSGVSLPQDRPSPGMELDLRGQRADEALVALDRYLDSAYLAGLPFVRIIHGKGTGRLRTVVRQALSEHPQVKSYQSGSPQEGGEGVTVAKLTV